MNTAYSAAFSTDNRSRQDESECNGSINPLRRRATEVAEFLADERGHPFGFRGIDTLRIHT